MLLCKNEHSMKTRSNTQLALVAPLATKKRCVDQADKLCVMFGNFTFKTVTKMTVDKAPKKRHVAKKSQFGKKRSVAKKSPNGKKHIVEKKITVKIFIKCDSVDEICSLFGAL